jgi:hypothetical protein
MGVLAAITAMAVGALSVGASPSSATISFCTKVVCIGQPNGCLTDTTKGVVISAGDGDSFIASDGTKWTCVKGKWVKTTQALVQKTFGPVLGLGLWYQGPPPPSGDPCDMSTYFRDEVVGIAPCQAVIP